MGFSPFFIVPQACCVQILLIKMYVATMARVNTLGLFLDAESLGLEGYLQEMIALGEKVNGIDTRCGQARVLKSVVRVREWVVAYKKSVVLQSDVVVIWLDQELFVEGEGLMGGNGMFDWDAFAPFDEGFDYDFGDMFAYAT
jgi:hypothetical protein